MNSDANALVQLREECSKTASTPEKNKCEGEERAWFFAGGLFPPVSLHNGHHLSPSGALCCSVGADEQEPKATGSPHGTSPRPGQEQPFLGTSSQTFTHQRSTRQESEAQVPQRCQLQCTLRGEDTPGAGLSLPSGLCDLQTQTVDETAGHHLPFDFSLSAGFI